LFIVCFELDSGDFARARDAFRSMSHNLAVESIIRGLTPGRIYVDNREDPSSALTWFKGRVFLSGDPDDRSFANGVSEILSSPYRDMVVRHGGSGFALYYHPESWGTRLGEMLPNASRTRHRRLYYRLDASKRSWDVSPPEGYALLPIDSELLERTDLEDIDGVVDEMKSERSTVEAFLEKSFGYCVVHSCAIVGWCMSEYNAGDRCELGIATAEGHRRRGLATLTGRAAIREAVSKGITDIGWHCYASNTPSVATAERLGFARGMEYPVIRVNFN
jgi:RimJ/RimL family protein N-acetyltransferase